MPEREAFRGVARLEASTGNGADDRGLRCLHFGW